MNVLKLSNRFLSRTTSPVATELRRPSARRVHRSPHAVNSAGLSLVPPVADGDEGRGSSPVLRGWLVQSLLLEAITREEVGDAVAVEAALARALDVAERDRVLLPFLFHPVPELLERHAGLRAAHANLVAEIFGLLVGGHPAAFARASDPPREALTETEARVLRYLPTDLSKPEIAKELYVSVDTIKTHVKHLYAKLDVHSRREAVLRAVELGLLPQSARSG